MSRILVPVDDTEQSLQALRFALAYAKDKHELTLLHVVPFYPSKNVINHLGQKQLREYQLQEAHEELAKVKELADQSGIPYTLEIRFGDVPQIINEFSKINFEAMVMGTHGYGRLMGYLMQSVSYPTIHDVKLPVFLISDETNAERFPWSKVLIAVDGSEQAKEAIEKATALSQSLDVTYSLVTVVPPPVSYAGAYGPGWQDVSTLEEWGKSTLLPYEEMMQEKGVTYQSQVLIGDPATVIKQTAKEQEADLIVLGHHGMGGVAGTMMGSVTFKLVHRVRTPLLIVKK
ncbi:universal stress protein [Brevibacillus panacihumi]|uniref:universal stress protein n=1 Tax=Brevibacillus panacihumi TaxID=497735 RepID=UPI003D193631